MKNIFSKSATVITETGKAWFEIEWTFFKWKTIFSLVTVVIEAITSAITE